MALICGPQMAQPITTRTANEQERVSERARELQQRQATIAKAKEN